MATQLKNTLSIVGLAAGATVVIPHELNWNDVPKRPDIILGAAVGLTITADTVNVTVRNDTDGPFTGDLLVESWHTVERAFGPADQLALLPQPFIVRSIAASGQGSTYSFVYRPGDLSPGGNVFTDWTALVAAMTATAGPKLLVFDDSIVSPIPIPVGIWNMKGVTWTGILRPGAAPAGFNSLVELSEGVRFTLLRSFVGPITVINRATATSPIADIGGDDAVNANFSTTEPGIPVFINLGTVPLFFINIPPGPPSVFLGIAEVGGASSTSPVFGFTGGGTFFYFAGIRLDDDMFGGPGPAVVIYRRVFFAAEIGQQDVAFGVFLVRAYAGSAASYGLNPDTPAPPAIAPVLPSFINEVIRLDSSGGAIAQVLPDIKAPGFTPGFRGDTRGQTVIVKELSGSPGVTVAPFAGQTIDGGAGAVVVAAGAAAMFVSDGVSNWMQIV